MSDSLQPTPDQLKRVQTLILDAFDQEDLERVLLFELGANLDEMVSPKDTFSTVLSKVLLSFRKTATVAACILRGNLWRVGTSLGSFGCGRISAWPLDLLASGVSKRTGLPVPKRETQQTGPPYFWGV